jgi:hypothetical protein
MRAAGGGRRRHIGGVAVMRPRGGRPGSGRASAAARAALAGIASKGGLTAETIAEIEAAAKLL